MCKKYVNANLTCFESVVLENGVPLAFRNPFDEISAKKSVGGVYQIGGFRILSNINILGTADLEKQKDHILYQENGVLDFTIRLTKCDTDVNGRFYYDLDSFSLNIAELRENHQIDGACFDFVNYARITEVPNFTVDKSGSYVIKLLIKENTEDKPTVQFIRKFFVKAD